MIIASKRLQTRVQVPLRLLQEDWGVWVGADKQCSSLMDWIFLFQTAAIPARVCTRFDSKQSISTRSVSMKGFALILHGNENKIWKFYKSELLPFVWLWLKP